MDPTLDGNVVLENPLGLDGLDFIEYASPDPAALEDVFLKFGFQRIGQHKRRQVTLYRQNQVNFVINNEPGTFARKFARQHGPSICAVGFRARSAQRAFDLAVQRGARPIDAKKDPVSHSFPAIYGVGDSAIYFVDRYRAPVHFDDDFRYLQPELTPKGRGLTTIDHVTNNVPKGELRKGVDFYRRVLGFHEVQHFAVRGERTGLTARVMRSPCRKITIQINEPTEEKSQIQEYLDEYRGAGVRHVAMTTTDIVGTARGLADAGVDFLEAPPAPYYEALPERVPGLREDRAALRARSVLVDGHPGGGYLLQAFTKKTVGPIFFEIIQRANHSGLGEDNVRSLFAAIERDQTRRGYL